MLPFWYIVGNPLPLAWLRINVILSERHFRRHRGLVFKWMLFNDCFFPIYLFKGTTATSISSASMAGSNANSYYGYAYGSLGYSTTKSWRPSSSSGAYLEMSLSAAYYITSIETRGGPSSNYYVTSYTVRYYNDTSADWVCAIFH